MRSDEVMNYVCDCGAVYRVVPVESDPANDCDINCCRCGVPLDHRDGDYALKYFLVGPYARPQRRHSQVHSVA